MELKEIKSVIDLMSRNGLSEFELEKDDFKIRICKSSATAVPQVVYQQNPVPVTIPAAATAAPGVSAAPAAAETPKQNLPTINSPMVGTFYRTPSPDSAPYVEVGTEVNEDTVVCIIEAMKVMNEIKAETKGVITAVLAEGGKSVEFGQPLFSIKPL
ncbi:MAG: acetyl-CoA carboxylase biotin carboxyl carrier protein [Verrucomicrobiales bacterium]|jgi:acetyl-CoA carboxylase biotin carboxyl carrier protein|nr:acetyl-CoA carboxylase biotin carboxyl carrier protein [Verrucomicrobiales bacterium]